MDEQMVFRALLEAQEQGQPVALVTIIRTSGSMPRHTGSKMVVRMDGSIVGTIGGGTMEQRVIQAAIASITDNKSRIESYHLNDPANGDPGVCGGTAEMFIEPILTTPTLLVIGGGHVGKALAELGRWMNYRVVLSDDRPEFCSEQYLPELQSYLTCKAADISQHMEIGPQTYIAAVTRGMTVDVDLIPMLLKTNAAYIGVIGSRRRWMLTVKALEERGITADQLERIHAPIGLELQAETPHEIAISIMAEIIMVQRGGTGRSMKWSTHSPETNLSESEWSDVTNSAANHNGVADSTL